MHDLQFDRFLEPSDLVIPAPADPMSPKKLKPDPRVGRVRQSPQKLRPDAPVGKVESDSEATIEERHATNALESSEILLQTCYASTRTPVMASAETNNTRSSTEVLTEDEDHKVVQMRTSTTTEENADRILCDHVQDVSQYVAGKLSARKANVVAMLVSDSFDNDAATSFSAERKEALSLGDFRTQIANVLLSSYTECAVTLVILFNVGLIIYETDQEAQCYPKFASNLDDCPTSPDNISWVETANLVLLIFYSIEALTSIYALRRQYFESKLNWLDLIIVVVSWLSFAIAELVSVKISWLRIFRVCRMIHGAFFVARVHELQVLIFGFIGCMRAVLFGTLVLLALLCFCAILAVSLVHPINSQIQYDSCDRCPKGFQSISASMLTLYQQTVAGDSWGTISIPIVEKSPWGLVLPIFHIVIGLGAMNLILAVIVDAAMEARVKKREVAAQDKARELKMRKVQLLDLVQELDLNKDGVLQHDEIFDAIQNHRELQTRIALSGLHEGEVRTIVNAVTVSPAQTISYKSFCNVLDDLDAADVRKTVVLTKVMLSGMEHAINERLDKQSEKITSVHRAIEQLIDLYSASSPSGNTVGTHAQPHPGNVKQDQSATCSPHQHNYPHITSTVDLDIRLGKSLTDAIVSCKAEIESEMIRGQESLMKLDTEWSASLRALEETLAASADSDDSRRSNARFLDHATRTHQALERRRHNLHQDITRAIEDDFSLWVRQCSFLDASDKVHAKHEQHASKELIHFSTPQTGSWQGGSGHPQNCCNHLTLT